MYIEGFEQWIKLNRNLTTPLGDWNKATTELGRRLAQQNLEIFEENFSRWSDQIKRLSNIRKPEDFINLQKECINENVHATLANIQKLIQTSLKNFEDFSKLYGTLQEQPTFSSKPPEKREKRKSHKKA